MKGGWEREDEWMLLAFLSVQSFVPPPPPTPRFAFFPLIGCTDLAHEMKRFSLPMLPQSDSHPQQKGGTRHDQ